MSSILEQALGIVGLVILYHNSIFPLPNLRPFNCPMCTSTWLAISTVTVDPDPINVLVRVGVTALVSGVLTILTPAVFREF